MSSENPEALVGTEWLAEHISDPDIRILDCTWHHASTNLDGRTQYRGRHIPGAVHFDIDHVADRSTSLPHMLPRAADFAQKVGLLGIGNGDRVIVYDRLHGGGAAARVWWMFRVFGHDNVAMLDGGYGKWTNERRPADMAMVRPEPRSFIAGHRPELVRSLAAGKPHDRSGAAD
jgi:thiosulfate/3-mercaptopyruvate sulfurtransferase